MIIVFCIISASFLLLTLMWLYRIHFSFKNILRDRDVPLTPPINLPIVNILLPVLDENIRLREFEKHFRTVLLPAYANLRLWIITTEREVKEYNSTTTLSVADELASGHSYVQRIHYPETAGVMAHQLNFAIKHIDNGDIFAIYNADSLPEPQTFEWVAHALAVKKNIPLIFQQYGVYTKNLSSLRKARQTNTLVASAYWQTRWAIGFEYYRARVGAKRQQWPRFLTPFNYCIGHGLFITRKAAHLLVLSERTMNEDAILGIEAAAKNIEVVPIPFFDLADSPDTVKSVFMQKSNWFQGPFQSFLYYKLLKGEVVNKKLLYVDCLKLFSHAIYWLVGPLSTLVLVCLSVFIASTGEVLYCALILSFVAFLVLPALYTQTVLTNILNPGSVALDYSTKKVLYTLLLGAWPAYIVHGAAAMRGFVLHKRIINRPKGKTVMSEYGNT